MKEVFIFAGTTEGRELSEILSVQGVPCTVSVATEYGAQTMEEEPGIRLLTGRMNREAMAEAFRQRDYACVVDATHPFAVAATEEIRSACGTAGLPYLRLSRKMQEEKAGDGVLFMDTMEEALDFLNKREGNILLMTGSKDLSRISAAVSDRDRLFARVLPSAESIALCEAAGLKGRHIIAMQGPFSEELNRAMLSSVEASWLLTKETGSTGGFAEKLSAAQKTGVTAVVIRNPESLIRERETQGENPETGKDFPGVLSAISEILGQELSGEQKRVISLAGIGPGSAALMTEAVKKRVREADVIFGAERILESLGEAVPGQERIPFYQSGKIFQCLMEHPEYRRPLVVFSGDTGFFSGAALFLKKLQDKESPEARAFEADVLCGISSVIYFCSRIGQEWQDARLLSRHGRPCNVTGHLRHHRKCLLLVSDVSEVRSLGEQLQKAEEAGILPGLRVFYGYQLSYPEEETGEVRAEDLCGFTKEGLYVLMFLHSGAEDTPIVPGLPDSAFIRGKTPMTKEEVRTVSLSKLKLSRRSVVYDIGAGTGSVSVEAALLCTDGQVYAVEYKDDAVELLRKNRDQFCLENLEVIQGKAPEAMEDLPAPTHAFIGGSAGNMEEILRLLLKKNPGIRTVVNCIALETLSEITEILKRLPVSEPEYIQLSASRAEPVGRYHLLKAQNPIFIVTFQGTGESA